jgi:hypothetical protein
MNKPLVTVAASGILVSTVCLTLAGFLSGDPGRLLPVGWQPPWQTYLPFSDAGGITTRSLSWAGGRIEIDVPATVHFSPGPQWKMTVTGSASALDRLRLADGRLSFNAPPLRPGSSSLEVRMTGPQLDGIALNGSGSVTLENIAQESLDIDLLGSGSITASGRVERARLDILGSGSARLGDLVIQDLDARILGSGDADVAPTGTVTASIFGSGNLVLHTNPARVSSRVLGSGRVIERAAAPGAAAAKVP